MKACLPVVVLLLGLATCGSASFLKDLLGFDCIEKGGRCNTLNRPCCGEDQCYFSGGLSYKNANKGECVTCVTDQKECQRNNQCCQTDTTVPSKCQKEHPGHANGVCGQLFKNSIKCYKDNQCISDNCLKPRFWHMYGRCAEKGAVIEVEEE